jgi:ABC-type sugar transport system ATPase subunit
VRAAVEFIGITKRYPGVTALDGVSFSVAPGSCHAVCGENGAGKSTLGKLLSGIAVPDAGEIRLDGTVAHLAGPRDALALGVAMVHQELAFCGNMTVAENLCLGRLPRRLGFVDRRALRERALERLAAIGARVDPQTRVDGLTIADQQLVQIAGAVASGARVIVFDEPTSSLAETDAERLFELIDALRRRGVTILYVSHRMAEIQRLCDTITVLRDGRHVATRAASELPEAALVELMIGRQVGQYYPTHVASSPGRELLRVERLCVADRVREVSFALHAGEVLGLAGLVGAGRSEIARAIFGLEPAVRGTIFVRGDATRLRSPRDAMAQRIGFVPEDRKRQGLVLSMRASENGTLTTLSRHAHAGWINHRSERRAAMELFDRLRVRASPDTVTRMLSGGNQQKLVMAKWLAADADILLLDEPTRGVDVAAKAELHGWIDELASHGAAVLLISSELPELLNLSTRVLVLREGRVVGDLPRAAATQAAILRLMTGLSAATTTGAPGTSRPSAPAARP